MAAVVGGPQKTVIPCCAEGVGLKDTQPYGHLSISRHHPTSPGLGIWG
jgi:hypothetical protein